MYLKGEGFQGHVLGGESEVCRVRAGILVLGEGWASLDLSLRSLGLTGEGWLLKCGV